jgi:hypothetical protein
MKTITQYQAEDGRIFNNKAECLNHDAVLRNIDFVMHRMPKRPQTSEFENGDGYIQHNPQTVELVKNALIDMWQGEENFKLESRAHPARYSILGRIFSECNSPLAVPWQRLCCIDDHYREWGQPFFALHPDKGNQIRLNP